MPNTPSGHGGQKSLYNLLEPPALIRLFRDHPPLDFVCPVSPVPLFFTNYDLLTTLGGSARSLLEALPFIKPGSGPLTWSACFAGTTVTEYAPLPKNLSPDETLDLLLAARSEDEDGPRTLHIIKDLPSDSPLLPEEDNHFARKTAEAALARGFISVEGQALAHVPISFTSEEDYLSRLSASRRKDLRRKLKKRNSLDISSLPLGHPEIASVNFIEEAYELYLQVFEQSEIHFDLLSREYFAALLGGRDIQGVIFLYRHMGRLAGYNICLEYGGNLVDKYIGFRYPLARELNLYFISWMVNLAYARSKNYAWYIAGWTDPEVKASLGASFTFTRHLVWVKNPVLRAILRPLRRFFETDANTLRAGT